MHQPPPEVRTSNTELLGSTTGLILTAIAAVVGLAIFIGAVYVADAQQGTKRLKGPRRGRDQVAPPEGEISPGQGGRPWDRIEHRDVPEGGHPHGSRSSFVLVAVVIAAFTVGGISIGAHAWWLFWTCAGIVVLCVPAGKAIGIMNDTISWGSTVEVTEPDHDVRAVPAEPQQQQQAAGPARARSSPGR
jgi:hypothetical protein